jgi:hypothetical protein
VAGQRVHEHHVEAALRQPEPVRVARAEVDASAQPLLGREAPARLHEARADVDRGDRPAHLGAAGDGAGRHARAAAEVHDRLRSDEREVVHVVGDGGEEERVPAAALKALGHDGERLVVHLLGAPVQVRRA